MLSVCKPIVLALLMIMSEIPAGVQTNDGAVYVATYIDVQPSSTTQGIALMKQYREASRTEGGNAGIDVFQEISRPNRFVIIELWKDQSSFQAHEKASETTLFRSRLQAVHNSPHDQRVHQGFAIASASAAAERDTLWVVTHVDVPPPRREEAEVLLNRVAEESRKEDGNGRYDVFQQTQRTNHFTVLATWRDGKTFDSHEMKPHTRQFREALGPMLGALYDERIYRPLN
jgi:quinol monooxygenase YgiN